MPKATNRGSQVGTDAASSQHADNASAAVGENHGVINLNSSFGAIYAGQQVSDPGLTTGPIRENTLERALHAYAHPRRYAEALSTLRQERLLIIEGATGCGKEAAALNLLHDCSPSAVLEALPPSATWEQLAKWKYKPDRAYVIASHDTAVSTDFAILASRIQDTLSTAGGHCRLVITRATSAIPCDQDVPTVTWVAPDIEEIIAAEEIAHDTSLQGKLRTELIDAASADPSPSAVGALAHQVMKDIDRADEILARHRESSTAVLSILDSNPSTDTLAVVVTFAFFPDAPVPVFERLAITLQERLDRSARRHRPRITDAALPQRRSQLMSFPLIRLQTHQHDEIEARDQWVQSAHHSYQRHCLEQLWRRYGDELWTPVAHWLDVTVTDSDDEGGTGWELCHQLATSLALLGQFAPTEVLSRYLEVWVQRRDALGNPDPHFLVAAHGLALLDHPNRAGLERALEWTASSDGQRAAAGMVALATVGQGEPFEALNALWRYSAKGPDHQAASDQMIGLFFAVAVRDKHDGPAAATFRFLRKRLQTAPGASTRRARERPYRLMLQMMKVRPERGKPTSCAALLARSSDSVEELTALLCQAFGRLGYRADAIRALKLLLDDAYRHFPDAGIPASVAEALTKRLPAAEASALAQDMIAVFNTSRPPCSTRLDNAYAAFFAHLATADTSSP